MFLFNKKAPKKINFNGFHVAEVIYNGITVWVEKILTLISGKTPLTLDASFGEDIVDYKIYGESVQEATPSITIPVEVESVGDKTKNLFDIEDYPDTTSGNARYIDITKFKIGTELTISANVNSQFKISSASGAAGALTRDGKTCSFTMKQEYIDIGKLYIISRATWNSMTKAEAEEAQIQLEYGLTPTEYEPYYENYKIPIVVRGKNLFDYTKLPIRANEIDGSIVEHDGVLCYRYRDGDTSKNYGFIYTADFKENTQYTFTTRIILGEDGKKAGIKFKYIDGTQKVYDIALSNKIYSFISEANKTVGSIETTFYNASQKYMDLSVTQLEEGITATDYEPYHEPVTSDIYLDEPLRKIGEYVDYIDFENGKVVRKVGAGDLTTITNTNYISVGKTPNQYGYYRNYYLTTDKFVDGQMLSGTNLRGYSNFLPCSATNTAWDKWNSEQVYFGQSNTVVYVITANQIVEKTDLIKYISNNGAFTPYIYYILATPIEKKVELPTLPTFEGTTIIEVNTNITPNVEINYYKQGG